MGTHCSQVFTASGSTTSLQPPTLHILHFSPVCSTSDGDERYDDIDGHICIPSERILFLSLTDALLSICKSVPLGQTNQSTLPDHDDDEEEEEEEEDCFGVADY